MPGIGRLTGLEPVYAASQAAVLPLDDNRHVTFTLSKNKSEVELEPRASSSLTSDGVRLTPLTGEKMINSPLERVTGIEPVLYYP